MRSRTPDPYGVDDWLTEKELLAAARRNGCTVSADQLKRWRRAELIPRPRQRHPTGQRGSTTAYPPGTLTQLLAVCELRKRFKKLDRIRFELWWSGHYGGPTGPIRAFLIARLEALLTEAREHRDRFEDPADAAEAAVSGPIHASRNPALRVMRRLAKDDENVRSVLYAVLLELFGGEVPWDHDTRAGVATLLNLFGASVISDAPELEPSLRELVERATGFDRAKTDRLDEGVTLLPDGESFVDVIRTLFRARLFDLDEPGWAIEHATDNELETARIRARLTTGLSPIAQVVATQHGRDYAGMTFLAIADIRDPAVVAVVFQYCVLIPSLWTPDPQTIHGSEALDELAANQAVTTCVELFLKELPQYAFVLKPDAESRLAALTTEERTVISDTITSFLNRHPECTAAINAAE
jgi:hypothetical protein